MPKKTSVEIVLTIQATTPDTFGTNAIVLGVATKTPEGVRYPSEIGGLTNARDLEWRYYRASHRNGDSPRVLRANAYTHYHRPMFVDLGDAAGMVRTLRTIKRRLDAQRDKYGPTEDFAECVLRIAHAVGAARIAISWVLHKEATGDDQPSWADDNDTYTFYTPGDARCALQAIARIDVTARCFECRRPVADGRTRCYEHEAPIVHEAHLAAANAK